MSGKEIALVGVLGWLLGSFLNQLVDRSPPKRIRGTTGNPQAEPDSNWPSLLRPSRSICFTCHQPIAWYDNVPVFSYLWLRGLCRRCGAAIGRRTLWMELATPLLWLALLWGARAAGLSNALLPPLLAVAAWAQVALLVWLERRQMPAWLWAAGLLCLVWGAAVLLAGPHPVS